jgi:hypothetical protein
MKSFEPTSVSVAADDRLSMAVIDLVARASDTDPLELDPLYDAIDPDLLDSLPDSDGFSSLEFAYHGYTISIADVDGEVMVTLEGRRISADDSSSDFVGGESST